MVCKMVYVFMADHEWGNALMDRLARETFAEFPDADVVHVHEHGGWSLGYRRDMKIVSSANDCACFPREIDQWRESITDVVVLANIRRDRPAPVGLVAA
ncbi:MAG: hypothetical protein IT186_21440 [Acidobacteria bacterium]|nr:hypothetical protein [Acidobacteriota bacterium]